jgi:chromosome segregation ATPase
VSLEVRRGTARSLLYEVSEAGFLIGSVPGCDLRLPGADLPPVLCLIAGQGRSLNVRKLVPTYPLLVNGEAVSSSPLGDGDCIALGPVELLIHVMGSSSPDENGHQPVACFPKELEARSRELDERQKELEEQTAQLETDRVIWYRRREEIVGEVQELQENGANDRARLQRELENQVEELAAKRQEAEAARQEFATLRQQLHDRYRERRDRLAGLQEAVNRAANKVQERKRQVDVEVREAEARRAELDARARELEEKSRAEHAEWAAHAQELAEARQALQHRQRGFEQRQQDGQRQLGARQVECEDRARQLAEAHHALAKQQAQYQADLLRLDRLSATLEERQRDLDQRLRDADQRHDQLRRDSQELEEHVRQLDEWRARLEGEAARIARDSAELQAGHADLGKRAAALEGQQAMLASMRTRLERMREEVRREDQMLAEQRGRQQETELELQRKVQEVQRLRTESAEEEQQREEANRRLEERQAVVEAAVAQMRQLQDKVAQDEEQLRQCSDALEARAAQHAEEAALLEARSLQVAEIQDRLSGERQALREREATLAQDEIAREALQEQLRRRAEGLAERQRGLADKDRQQTEAAAELEARRAEDERTLQQAQGQLAAQRDDLDRQAAVLSAREDGLRQREEALHQHIERLKESGRAIAQARKSLSGEKASWETQRREAAAAVAQSRAEVEALRHEAGELHGQLPQWEVQAQAAAERLAQARDELRRQLNELHTYAREAQHDLDALRTQVQADAGKVRDQGLALHRDRDEHRLGVAAFRQQLIEWQARVAELKRSLSQDETRRERRHAEVEATSARLARQAEDLDAQERAVTLRRDEMERHLADMRDWYRRKLRELTERFFAEAPPTRHGDDADERAAPALSDADTAAPTPVILALTGEVDPGDRQLGEILRSLELVDADTLAKLLVEARKQRQSLRQVLLASGSVTLYQLALIEAGNLAGLMLGPVRVLDRLRVSARETVYRVFDARRAPEMPGAGEGDVVLRHLAEAEMQDAVRPDEFRQRFAAAARVQHPHLAATLEVLEIQARPAVLQERVTGLSATDWPALFAVSGVWFRLLGQAALGLHTAHEAGLVHGHLHPSLLVLTGGGTLKICGLGEPAWLAMPETLPVADGGSDAQPEPGDDLVSLGRIAAAWANMPATRRKRGKAKSEADSLHRVLQRLSAPAPELRYSSARALLEDLDRISSDVPPNPEAWDRMLRYVREHGQEERILRKSA